MRGWQKQKVSFYFLRTLHRAPYAFIEAVKIARKWCVLCVANWIVGNCNLVEYESICAHINCHTLLQTAITAMRWTKGNHAFIVATHIDKAHIHNHIIYNSTSLDNKRKFHNFFLSSIIWSDSWISRTKSKRQKKNNTIKMDNRCNLYGVFHQNYIWWGTPLFCF